VEQAITRRKRSAAVTAIVALAGLAQGTATAAGGHFAVDDAVLLEPGHCGPETWWTHGQGSQDLLHGGMNCRVGPVELGGAVEHSRGPDGSETERNLEIKWARQVAERLSVGVDLQPTWQPHTQPRPDVTRAVLLATWRLREELALHLNLGRDFVPGGPDLARQGVALEWQPAKAWTVIADRYLDQGTNFLRTGVRWIGGDAWSLDLSRAQRLSGPAGSNWTLGFNYDFRAD
jgi:hypothetical protein